MDKKELLKSLERKITGTLNSRLFNSAIRFSGKNEIEYLLKGHATELIESMPLPQYYDKGKRAFIYGVIAAEREYRRYVWIYFVYDNHFWKCRDIKHSFEIIERLKGYNELVKDSCNLSDKIFAENKKLEICNN